MAHRGVRERRPHEEPAQQHIRSQSAGLTDELAASTGALLDGSQGVAAESVLGHSFADVRIHADGAADAAAKAIDARAFTLGSDIYFRDSAFEPETPFGQRVLQHELVHVAQSKRAPHGRNASDIDAALPVAPVNSAQELEAERVASDVENGAVPTTPEVTADPGVAYRWPWDDDSGGGGGGGGILDSIISTGSSVVNTVTNAGEKAIETAAPLLGGAGGIPELARPIGGIASTVGQGIGSLIKSDDPAKQVGQWAAGGTRSVIDKGKNIEKKGEGILDWFSDEASEAKKAISSDASSAASWVGGEAKGLYGAIDKEGGVEAANKGALGGLFDTVAGDYKSGNLGLGTLSKAVTNEVGREQKSASIFKNIGDLYSGAYDWGEDKAKGGIDWMTGQAKGIPVLEGVANTLGSEAKFGVDFAGGFGKAVTGAVTGIGQMAENPLGTVMGLNAMVDQTAGGYMWNKAKGDALAAITGKKSLGAAAGDLFSTNTLSGAWDSQMGLDKTLAGGYIDSYNTGKYGEMAGRATFDIGGLILGAGAGGAAADAGVVGDVADMSKGAGVIGDAADLSKGGAISDAADASNFMKNPALKQAGEIRIPQAFQNAEGGFDVAKWRAAGSPEFGLGRDFMSNPALKQAGPINIPPEFQNPEGGFDVAKWRAAGSPKFGLNRAWPGGGLGTADTVPGGKLPQVEPSPVSPTSPLAKTGPVPQVPPANPAPSPMATTQTSPLAKTGPVPQAPPANPAPSPMATTQTSPLAQTGIFDWLKGL